MSRRAVCRARQLATSRIRALGFDYGHEQQRGQEDKREPELVAGAGYRLVSGTEQEEDVDAELSPELLGGHLDGAPESSWRAHIRPRLR
jgi:hypothetical protein